MTRFVESNSLLPKTSDNQRLGAAAESHLGIWSQPGAIISEDCNPGSCWLQATQRRLISALERASCSKRHTRSLAPSRQRQQDPWWLGWSIRRTDILHCASRRLRWMG